MQIHSNASKRLLWLYGQLLIRMRAADGTGRLRFMLRVHVETLPPRLLMSATATGTETLVNTTTSSAMVMPAIAMNPAGNSVVVWTTSSSGGAVLAQRYSISGSRLGTQFQIDQNPAGSAANPSVAIDDMGDFVVVWHNGASVYARVFNSAGTATTGDTLVTSAATGTSRPVVAMDAAGRFTVVWEGSGSGDSDGIFKQQFLLSGIATGSAVLANTTTAGSQTSPAIAMDSVGDTIIAWTDSSTSVSTVQAAYFAASGAVIPQFAAGTETGSTESNPAVGIDASGNFLIAWQTNLGLLSGYDITARAFSAAGSPKTANPFTVNSYTFGAQTNPSVAERADGSFIVSFTSQNQDLSEAGVYTQAYTAAGALDGNAFQVNTTWLWNQQDSAVAWTGGTAVIAWDGNGSGDSAGVFLQRYTTSGTANQAPVNTVPGTESIYPNSVLTFSSGNGNSISVSDADADGGVEQLSLTSTNGTLALSETAGLVFSSGGTGTAAMTFSGTLSSINAALAGMKFTPTSNFTGSAQIQLLSNDLGNTGSGGPASTSSSVTINIQPPPTLDTVPGAQTTLENTTLIFSPLNDNSVFAGSATTAVGLSVASGILTLATTSGLGFISGTSNGTGTIEFTGTSTALNAALNGLMFTPASNFTGSDPLTFITAISVANLTTQFSTYTVPISVTAPPPPVNQTPVVTAPSAETTAEGTALVLGGSGRIAVSDIDADGNAEQMTLTATNGSLTLASETGLAFSSGSGSGSTTMTFTGTLASINAAMNGLTFTPAAGFYGNAGIYASIDDLGNTGTGGAQSAFASIAITVTQVNQAPVLSVPSTQSASENGQVNFSSFNSNLITLSDADAGGASEQLALSTANGTLDFATSAGLTFTAGGSGQPSMTVVGSLANINAALGTLTFAPTAGFIGTASLQLNANDLGNSGPGGAKTASASVSIVVVQSLVVTTASDVADGNTSSVASLVASPGADGKISLREAILAIDNTPGKFAITFNIPGSGVKTIMLANALPQITNAVLIDATAQPGYSTTPLIELDGQATPAGTNGLQIGASNTTIQGLSIVGFTGNGIDVVPANVNGITIKGDYLGVTPAGAAVPDGDGLILQNSSDDTVGGATAADRNVISGNIDDGISVQGSASTDDLIEGNYVGTNPAGSGALSNDVDGIYLNGGDQNTIGGTSAGQGNVISGNGQNGIDLDSGATGNIVAGNFVGTNSDGTSSVANAGCGILAASPANQIGGTAAGAENIISGNTGYGIEVSSAGSAGNFIQGNLIGTNASGNASLGNQQGGIYLDQTSGTTIGGTADGAGNLISGNNNVANSADGILIEDGSANTIQGNFIGTDITGMLSLGNYHAGVNIESSTNNIIGGLAAGAANVIAYNGVGVDIWGSGTNGNSIRENSIFGNSSIGIDLGNDGVTPNTGSLNAALANQGMNFPVITQASLEGTSIALTGYVGDAPGQSAFAGSQIDIFISDGSLSNGQGQTYLGTLTADSSGNFSGLISAPAVADGTIITGTATDSAGDTSEFAANITILQVNQAPLLSAGGSQSSGENEPLTFSSDAGNGLSVADTDSNGGVEQATLSVASGSLTLAATSGITFVNGTANGSSRLIFQGTIGNINAALDGMVFTPAVDFSGPVLLVLSVNDLGNSGSGGARTSNVGVMINVNPVAHTPSVTNSSTLLNTPSSSGLVITPNPLDGASKGYYQIENITGGTLFQHDGTTPISNGQFITFAQGLAGLVFDPTLNSTAAGSFTVQAASSQGVGGLVASPVTATIAVDGPALSVPGLQSIAEDANPLFSAAAGNAISISDAGVGSGSVAVDLTAAAGTLKLGSLTGITVASGGEGESSIDFSGTVAAVNAALNGLTLTLPNHFTGADQLSIITSDPSNEAAALVPINVTPVAHTPTVTNAVSDEDQMTTSGLVITPSAIDAGAAIEFQITNITGGSLFQSDGITPIVDGEFITAAQGLAGLKFKPDVDSSSPRGFDVRASLTPAIGGLGGDVVAATVDVIPPSAPVIVVPAAQSISKNTPLVFSSDGGNAITVYNSDGGVQQISLMATNGTLTLATTAGLTMISGTGAGDSSVSFSASIADIDAALNGLTFTPTAGYSGASLIRITGTDAQSIVLGNPLSAAGSVGVTVAAPPMPALLADNELVTTVESTATIDSSLLDAEETGLSPDQLSFTVTQFPTSGRLLLGGQPLAAGASFTQQDINQGQVAYESTSTASTDDAFTFIVSDASGTSLAPAVFAIHADAAPTPPPVVPVKPPAQPAVPAPPTHSNPQNSDGGSSSLISDIQGLQNTTTTVSPITPGNEIAIVQPSLDLITGGDSQVATPALPAPKANAAPAAKNAPTPPAASPAPPTVTAAHKGSTANISNSAPVLLKANRQLWHDLDVMQQQADSEHEKHTRIFAGTATLVSAGMSVMYFVWAIRAGSILSSLLSSMPAWKLVDPLPILDQTSGDGDDGDEDDETLESMVEEPRRKAA